MQQDDDSPTVTPISRKPPTIRPACHPNEEDGT
jgi:hypothetical protein